MLTFKKFYKCLIVLACVISGAASAESTEIGLPKGIKLPIDGGPPGVLYQLDPIHGRATPLAAETVLNDLHFYLQYFPALSRWHWVTATDRNPIVAPSKVQGVRIGYPNGPYALDWFRLQPGDLQFYRTTDRVTPKLWRRSPQGNDYVAEAATDDWMTWGGTVSPPPGGATPPSCELVATPAIVNIGKTMTLRIRTTGTVTLAKINGTEVGVPEGYLLLTQPNAGRFVIKGEVTGPGGRGNCETNIVVEDTTPPDPPTPPKKEAPTCALYAAPSKILRGEAIRLEVVVSGAATKAEIDGISVELPRGSIEIKPTELGAFTAIANVEGPGGKNSCRAAYRVEDKFGPPPVEPSEVSCKISLSPERIHVGESSIATMTIDGIYLDATLDGVQLTGAEGLRRIAGTEKGNRVVEGRVWHAKGEATCRATIEVAP